MENQEKTVYLFKTNLLFPAMEEILFRITLEYTSMHDHSRGDDLQKALNDFFAGRIREDRFYRSVRSISRAEQKRSAAWIKKEHLLRQEVDREQLERCLQQRARGHFCGIHGTMVPWYRDLFGVRGIDQSDFDYLFFSCEMGMLPDDERFVPEILESLVGVGWQAPYKKNPRGGKSGGRKSVHASNVQWIG